MTASPLKVRVGGVWVDTIAAWGDLEVTHGRNGPLEASWGMALRDGQRPAPLVRNARTEIYYGSRIISSGPLDEPNWDAGTFTMIGTAREGEGAQCFNPAGAVTSKPNTAIDAAIARGIVSWTRASSFGDTDLAGPEGGAGTSDPDIGSINDLLNQWAIENNSQWRVSADGRLSVSPEDESTPNWLVLPGATVLGVASDNVTDVVCLRYFSSTDSQYRTARYPATSPSGGIERKASVTHLGPMTATRATAIAEGMYRKAQEGRTGWTNGMDLTSGQVITPGGHPANLALIRGGHTARLLDTPDPRGTGRNLNVVIAESTWKPAERTIQLDPVGMAARTWEQILEEANARGAA